MNRPRKICLPVLLLMLSLLLTGCGAQDLLSAAISPQAQTAPTFLPEETVPPQPSAEPAAETPEPVRYESGAGKVRITEIMSKNRATLRDSDGEFPDWVEIENICGRDLNLEGWSLCKNSGKSSWEFPPFTLYADSRALIFLSRKDRADNELHASFAVSVGDSLALCDRNGESVCECGISCEKADCSLALSADGLWEETDFPTPGHENTAQGYEYFMQTRETPGPLVISEVCVDNYTSFYHESIGYSDWVEIKNISSSSVDLSRFCLSDDADTPAQYTLSGSLDPGCLLVILCDKNYAQYTGTMQIAPFSLNSENEQLYLSTDTGEIIDYVSLKEIPWKGTYGRVPGQNGFFYLLEESPSSENGRGERRISATPELLGKDGIFNGVDYVTVELKAGGSIYYTLDSTVPTADSQKYTEPIRLTETGVVRAVCIEEGALPSRTLTLNYILNENHSLPVVCVSADNHYAFDNMYRNGYKTGEQPGCISFYESSGSFTLGCGIKMHGDTSLVLNKKNISVRFRGCYGQEMLNYDLFGGGVTEFSDLIIRAGQDQTNTIVRNEVCYDLTQEFSDSVVTERFRYCVLYVNGAYRGLYALMEKPNEQHYASLQGIRKDDVELEEATVYMDTELYSDVIGRIFAEDMSVEENYRKVEALLDIDSLIDWSILQAYFGNYDLAEGNLRYVRDRNGGKWRLVLYDLDCAFIHFSYCGYNVLSFGNQISGINANLLANAEYRDRFLSRAAEAYRTVLTQDHLCEKIEELAHIVAPEVSRDSKISGLDAESWQIKVNNLENQLRDGWTQFNIDTFCQLCHVTAQEREHYFGDLP